MPGKNLVLTAYHPDIITSTICTNKFYRFKYNCHFRSLSFHHDQLRYVKDLTGRVGGSTLTVVPSSLHAYNLALLNNHSTCTSHEQCTTAGDYFLFYSQVQTTKYITSPIASRWPLEVSGCTESYI